MLRRLRWLFLSLIIFYFWFTPGDPLSEYAGDAVWMPSVAGVKEGLLRIFSLCIIVLFVNVLLSTTSKEQLLGAIHWLAGPLGRVGVSPDRIAVRMVLVIEALAGVQELVRHVVSRRDQNLSPLRQAGFIAGDILQQVLVRADSGPCVEIKLPRLNRPPPRQCMYPVLLTLLFLMAQSLDRI